MYRGVPCPFNRSCDKVGLTQLPGARLLGSHFFVTYMAARYQTTEQCGTPVPHTEGTDEVDDPYP